MELVYKLLREVKVLPPSPQVLPKVLEALLGTSKPHSKKSAN